MKPGTKIIFHGGWSPTADRCSVCDWPCDFRSEGRIIMEDDGHYTMWDLKTRQLVQQPFLYEARLENGAYVVGYEDQFEIMSDQE